MWLFSKNGFFSIVQHRDDHEQVLVRARVKKDLVEIFPEDRIIHTSGADYHWRVYSTKKEMGEILLKQMTELDYPNFKGRIGKTPNQKDKLEAYHQIWSVMHDYSLKKFDKKNAYQGCLMGGAIGDALGAPIEFLSFDQIQSKYGVKGIDTFVEFGDGMGEFTDDTQMTLFTAEGLLRACHRSMQRGIGGAETTIVYHSYLRWLFTQDFPMQERPTHGVYDIEKGWLIKRKELYKRRAPGNTCLSSLASGKAGTVDQPINDSKGCGTVMRMAPVGLFFSDDMALAFDMGCKFSALTHGHPSGYLSGGFLAAVISGLCQHIPLGKSVFKAFELLFGKPGFEELDRKILDMLSLHEKRKGQDLLPEHLESLGGGWVAEEALAISLLCSLHYLEDFEKGVLAAVNHSGDSDSTGAITGNILGLIHGLEGIPEELKSRLKYSDLVLQMGEDLSIGVKGNTYEPDREWDEKYPGY
jgi:ADP-ribosylglycohydrolase